MSILYDPSALLKKIAPQSKIKRLLTRSLSYKRTALSFLNDVDFIDKESVSKIALKTIKGYRERTKDLPKDDKSDLTKELKADPKQLIQRVQNDVIFQIKEEIKYSYQGEQYEWLPSDADEPDPKHQLKYGEIFTIGVGEMPGDRIGCRCGMRILTNETELKLG